MWGFRVSPNCYRLLPEIRAITAAADSNCGAVALSEQSAGIVSFQRQQAGLPPLKNVDLAVTSLLPAVSFSGEFAFFAVNATTTATFITI